MEENITKNLRVVKSFSFIMTVHTYINNTNEERETSNQKIKLNKHKSLDK